MDHNNEAELIKRAKTDNDAFNTLYEYYFPKIYSFVVKRTGEKESAEDIVSLTFTQAFVHLEKYECRSCTFGAWLYKIATNKLIDHYRKHESHNLSLEDLIKQGAEFGFETDSEQKLVLAQVLTEVNQLSEDQKEVLLLQYVQDLDNATIALTLDKSEAAVKSLAFRGLETLRKKLNQ